MKTHLRCMVLAILVLGIAFFTPTSYAQLVAIIERGPHHAVVQTVELDGTTNTFTLLQTGYHRWTGTEYVPASDEVELVNGVPLARKTQYQVIFGTALDAPEGAVDILMLGGQRLRVRPMGIAYTEFKDGQSGKSVFVAETKGAAFNLSGRSEVTYPDPQWRRFRQHPLSGVNRRAGTGPGAGERIASPRSVPDERGAGSCRSLERDTRIAAA